MNEERPSFLNLVSLDYAVGLVDSYYDKDTNTLKEYLEQKITLEGDITELRAGYAALCTLFNLTQDPALALTSNLTILKELTTIFAKKYEDASNLEAERLRKLTPWVSKLRKM